MNIKSKYLKYSIILLILLSLTFSIVKIFGEKKEQSDNISGDNVESNTALEYLLDSYPIDEVPLYDLTDISSCKLYNNWDDRNISIFGDRKVSYFNVVLYTKASQSDFLNYYKNLFDEEIVDDYPMPDMVQGYVGNYRVTASHCDSNNTAYIQVYFPEDEVTSENIYFDTFPNLFEEDDMFVEEENSYGLLNQVGGQVEYTKYYTVIDSGDMDNDGVDDVDEFSVLISKYENMYKEKDSYNYDIDNHLISWEEDGYTVSLSLSKDHGRVYLNIRGSIDN